ncbi:MAG TPA: hypothetical protein VN759_03915 [Pseudolysinimonas sp.]|nr:hypothetical protein [Pseudolysinimonas sp.]
MHNEDHNPLNRSPYCGDPGALVSYLFNDGSADELAAIAAHVHDCDACSRELALLGDTRDVLSAWSPPQTELGFTLSPSDVGPMAASSTAPVLAGTTLSGTALSGAAAGLSVPWWRQSTPVWMQAVAATVVFGAGLAVGVSGRNPAPAVAPVSAGAAAVTRTELNDLATSLRAELARVSAAPAPAPVQTATRVDEEALLRRVQTLVTDSEERQRRELALRTTQVLRDMEIQRKVDMATVQQNIGQIQGTTGAELLKQRELYNMLMNNASLRGGAR